MSKIKKTMFREYDLRGKVNREELNHRSVHLIGKGFGTYLRRRKINTITVGFDSRAYSETIRDALVEGLLQTGLTVKDIGLTLSPVVYFSQYYLNCPASAMITASHNPNGWSGFKFSDGFSRTLLTDELQEIYTIIAKNEFIKKNGRYKKIKDINEAYLADVTKNFKLARPLKAIVDCGNGTAGIIAPQALAKIGAHVGEIFCNLDTDFPFHFPNPSNKDSREVLSQVVQMSKADIGFCIDGDGDRLGVVDEKGQTIWSDKILILLARQLLKKKPGATIVYDVKCTQALEEEILVHGGKPVMWKTGHSYIKQKMQEIKADLAGEHSGHIFYRNKDRKINKDRCYDDAVFAMLKLVEFVAEQNMPLSEIMASAPFYYASPNIIAHCPDEVKYKIVDQLVLEFKKEYDKVIDINGARVVFPDGWGLVRASSNLPELVLIFEAKTESRLQEIKNIFRKKLQQYPEIGHWENE
jgi:phosphomannomutase / phosphoglucomutase